jgi:hypothetical protein
MEFSVSIVIPKEEPIFFEKSILKIVGIDYVKKLILDIGYQR